MKRLLVVGNGFDLQAGLNTKFSDFFDSEEKPLIEKWLKDSSSVDGGQVSLLSLILYNTYYRSPFIGFDYKNGVRFQIHFQSEYQTALGLNKGIVNWMDVESFIAQLLKSKGLTRLIECFDSHFKKRSDRLTGICDYDDVPFLMESSLHDKGYFDITSFYEFFLKEINIFEKRFAYYIRNQLNSNSDYSNNIGTILSKMIPHTADSLSIINFNYTQIDERLIPCCGDIKNINVHGTINGEPIIGIDANDYENQDIMVLTKTFRKLVCKTYTKALDRFDEILIYGHSLGKQDYSYFQSIFDYVDLYNGSTKIIFYYSDNYIKSNRGFDLEELKNIHKTTMAKSVFGLIREYGKTLNNKDNGKNLIHKLLLEGRLELRIDNFI